MAILGRFEALWRPPMYPCSTKKEGGIGKSIPDAQEISQDPRDFPRAKPEGNLEGGGDGFPNTSRVLVEYGHSPHHQSYP